jgi:hypothetical protein
MGFSGCSGNTAVKRIKAKSGIIPCRWGCRRLGAGWGTTASVIGVAGNDVVGQITITSNGTGQAINAGFTLTFHDGTWTTAPLCIVIRADGFAPQGSMFQIQRQQRTRAFSLTRCRLPESPI